jgi:hypothetical protein
MRVTLFTPDFKTAWICSLNARQIGRVDNGHLISIGLVLGTDIQPSTLKRWIKAKIAKPTDAAIAKHSGCQSRCVLRGDTKCQW